MSASDCMRAIPWETAFELDDSSGLDSRSVSVHQLWRFLDLKAATPVELRCLGPQVRVAFPTDLASAFRLAREADRFDSIGTFLVPNAITPESAYRYTPDRWTTPRHGCTTKAEVTHRRAVYIDCDAERQKDSNATNDEKACAIRLANRVERWLSNRINPRCIGRGDSGNGASLFVAVEPTPCSDETDARIADLLRRLAAAFVEPGAKVDVSVHNRDRLVPLFGTMKRKGPHTADRPHRQTYFCCRAPVARIALSEIV